MRVTRRRFLRSVALGLAAATVPGTIDAMLARIARGATLRAPGYGPLVPDPAGLLDLPAGFRYRAFSACPLPGDSVDLSALGTRLSNSEPVPPKHDGMAAFRGPGGATLLVRNHECELRGSQPVDPARRRPYDALGTGGTTTLWVDRNRRLVKSFASLSGTLRNCAGGATPWGSWLSAEECVYVPGAVDATSADQTPDVQRRHGYVFEVDARAESLVEPVPLRAMGRFRHEAVAVDPTTGIAYLSEDRPDGLFYRFIPEVVAGGSKPPSALRLGDYARGGQLEALRIVGRPQLLANNWAEPALRVGEPQRIDWVRIEDPDPDMDMRRDPNDANPDVGARLAAAAPGSTRGQGFALGATQFARSEGLARLSGAVYFCCTDGGKAKLGQVFKLDPRANTLTLTVEPDDGTLLDGPDNLCAAPWGDLLVAEDGGNDNHVVGITPEGRLYFIARNAHAMKRELAGVCFAPDGRTLFVNLQDPGITFAIWGPWRSRRA